MHFGINGFIIRFAFTLQGFVAGLTLSQSGYVNPTPGDLFPAQPASAILGLRLMTAAAPALASLVVIWALERYPLHGARLAGVRNRLAALRR
jgi:GPH family glycoside/pentoside/hexuronide:cation symporter